MLTSRTSGILVHPTAFPTAYGIGDFGDSAYQFLEKLEQANQRLWQILPLCPVDYSGSPYQSSSAFAGEPLLISPDLLAKEGWLLEEELNIVKQAPQEFVDYSIAKSIKYPLFLKAFTRFSEQEPPNSYTEFCAENAHWLEDYTLFSSMKESLQKQRMDSQSDLSNFLKNEKGHLTKEVLTGYYNAASWCSFPIDLRKRNPLALDKWRKRLKSRILWHTFLQYCFHKQWQDLKAFANERNISIVGDAPIFVAYDSVDVWANQKSFLLDSKGFPKVIAGVPPDYFSEKGQLWGNPLYNWKEQKKNGYAWWMDRIQKAFCDVDILRIDHFRGFEAYWEVAAGAEDAIGGTWKKSVGIDFFHTIEKKLGKLPIIAEDLGIITEEVKALRLEAGFSGMAILQFAFGGDGTNPYLPYNVNKDTVIYTGTHDNNTTKGWYAFATDKECDHYRRYCNADGSNVTWDMIRLAFASSANTAIIPVQDVLNLDENYRMNMPGTVRGNWSFTFQWDMWNDGQLDGLRYLSDLFARNCD
ncbi:4-alpha-glucanotransferase [Chakrabartyella piscis]|uniref:4-alpha-glucanotransferase n=1 Tax=Chakrabartyella piscis TaxID=2918914 RepID=UPI00295869F2|nr:4-alpha-glucanotransferase [Chakrabartyella piscis]